MGSENAKNRLLPCRIHTRLTQEKYDELSDILERSRSIRSLSELLRYILDNKPIVIKTYDTSMDKVMEQLAAIHKELQALGININQITRSVHQSQLPKEKIAQANEVILPCERITQKIAELFELMTQLFDKWLPE